MDIGARYEFQQADSFMPELLIKTTMGLPYISTGTTGGGRGSVFSLIYLRSVSFCRVFIVHNKSPNTFALYIYLV